MWTNMQKIWLKASLLTLAGLLASVTSVMTYAQDPPPTPAEFFEDECSSCHSLPAGPMSTPYPINLGNYTNSSIKTKINNDMPFLEAYKCVDNAEDPDDIKTCATDMANYLIPPTSAPPPVITTRESHNLVGTGPLDARFSARLSSCNATPCVLVWDFGGGITTTQTTTAPNSLTPIVHTFTGVGSHRVELTMTDFLGETDEAVIYAYVTTEESFESYVETCKEELDFNDNDIPNDLNCTTGFLFANNGSAINDFVDYRQVTGSVDLVFACRWLQNDIGSGVIPGQPFFMARSIELLIHNRENGNTCFFRAKEHDIPVTGTSNGGKGMRTGSYTDIVSPTVAAAAVPGTPEAEYWVEPMELAQEIPCVDCHIAGPYIASPRIAPFLQRFGLLNDGHDTLGRELADAEGDYEDLGGNYHVVGETLGFMNHFAAFNNNQNTCANGCHSIGEHSVAPTINASFLQNSNPPVELIPSIELVISKVETAGVMPANAPSIGSSNTSDYTWINRDNPYVDGSPGDSETFVEAREEFDTLLLYCEDPGYITAHVVDSDIQLKPDQFSDQLSVFNAQDGVICLTSEQSDGQCNNFRVRYQCTDSEGNTSMTDWYNTDSPSGTGDYERRSDHANVCIGMEVTSIEASSTISTGWTSATAGPLDRLAQFDRYGLVCNNSDQTNGQCSNYVVKFHHCRAAPATYTTKIKSAWSGRFLTDSDNGNNAEAKAQPQNGGWDTQDWVVEPESGTGYVRLKNVGSGLYLNVKDDYDGALVVAYSYQADWGSQQWVMESVSGSADVRLKNVWTGRYLTVTNNGDYSAILSQSLNLSWASQRWQVN